MNCIKQYKQWIINCSVALMVIPALAAPPTIDVVYPRERESDGLIVISRVNSNFIFGSVSPPDARLTINNTPVPLYLNGAFLTFLPVPVENQTYHLHAETDDGSSDTTVTFQFPNQIPTIEPTIPSYECPLPIRFLPGNNVTRTDPTGAYDLFPLPGTTCLASAMKDNFLKIRLTPYRHTWVEPRFVEPLREKNYPLTRSIYKITCQLDSNHTKVIIPNLGRPLFRIEDQVNPDRITLTLYQVISHIDLIQLNSEDPLLDRIEWRQPEDNVLQICLFLNHPSWGYSALWNDNDLEIKLNHPPVIEEGLQGLTVAIDAGHGGDQFGAIGPTRLSEKELNLTIAQMLQERLISDGANTVLVRGYDETLGLYQRIDRAKEADADLLISIHNNALADGIDPFSKQFGTGTYYYRPQSIDFARHVHRYLLKGTGLPDDGIYYDNLALVRPTDFPAVLVEIGYIMMPDQEERLRNKSYQKRCAKMLSRGIKSFVSARRKGK
jgi:N-acetylmuramoyl-L-alanine amidase